MNQYSDYMCIVLDTERSQYIQLKLNIKPKVLMSLSMLLMTFLKPPLNTPLFTLGI